jgi:integrase
MKSVSVGLFQHRNGTFYTIKRTGEKQAWRSLGTTDKNEALRKLVIQLDLASAETQPEFPRFIYIAEKWLGSIQHTIKPTTYEWRKWCVQHLVQRFGEQSINCITTSDIETWMHWRLKHASPATANAELGTLRLVFAYAIERGNKLDDPVQVKAAKILKRKQPIISSEDFEKLRDALNDEARIFVEFLAASGLRLSEAMALTVADVDLTKRLLSVRYGKTENACRILPLNITLQKLLDQRLGQIKRAKPNKPIWTSNHRTAIRLAARRANISCPGFHVFRRYFASRCAELNVPPKTLASWLGHASPEFSLRVYAKTSAEHGLTIAERLQF